MKLYDPVLSQFSVTVDELEAQRRAADSRLLRLIDPAGVGLKVTDPAVRQQTAVVDTLKTAERMAIRNLEKAMKSHPLGPWVQSQRGLGFKTMARLLGDIKDPYWKVQYAGEPGDLTVVSEGPRTFDELCAYVGLHVIDGRAPRLRRGQRANWKLSARARLYNCVDPIIKDRQSPYRKVYDDAKLSLQSAVYSGTFAGVVVKGKEVKAGDPLTKSHIEARAKRKVMKAILRDLYNESRRLYAEQP